MPGPSHSSRFYHPHNISTKKNTNVMLRSGSFARHCVHFVGVWQSVTSKSLIQGSKQNQRGRGLACLEGGRGLRAWIPEEFLCCALQMRGALCDKGTPCKSFPLLFLLLLLWISGFIFFAAYHNSLDFEDQVRSWSGACGICGGKSGTGLVLSPIRYQPTDAVHSYLEMYMVCILTASLNKPVTKFLCL